MKRKLFTLVMAIMAVMVCALCFVACTDDGDVSSVNGTYKGYAVRMDEDGKITSGIFISDNNVFKDGKLIAEGGTLDYSMKGDDIVVKGTIIGDATLKKIADGVYLWKDAGNCYVREDVTPPFEVQGDYDDFDLE